MSVSINLFLNYPGEKEFVDRLDRELGVLVADTSCEAHLFAGEFRFSATQFWLSRNDINLKGCGISSDTFQIRIESELPHTSAVGASCLVYSTLLKTIHEDLLVDESLLVFSSQISIARFTSVDGGLIDYSSGDRIAYVDLPSKLESWLKTYSLS